MSDIDTLLKAALELAEASSAFARKAWEDARTLDYKADGSVVTATDLAVESVWREIIQARFPDHGILGEEHGSVTGSSAYTWVFDPIDGTRQFGAGLMNFSSLIAVCRDGEPIIAVMDQPTSGTRFAAALGRGTLFQASPVRTSGRIGFEEAILSLANPDSYSDGERAGFEALRQVGRYRTYDDGSPAYGALARGSLDVCLNGGDLDAFDICALVPIVREAGGCITDWRGEPLTLSSSGAIVASASAALHDQVLERLA